MASTSMSRWHTNIARRCSGRAAARRSPTSATAAGTRWSFDGGITVPASSSPLSVRLPYSVAEAVDPEEAFVAALASCHMLTFLYVAAEAGIRRRRIRR